MIDVAAGFWLNLMVLSAVGLPLRVDEGATVWLPNDNRPLLLRVDDLRLERAPCQTGQ